MLRPWFLAALVLALPLAGCLGDAPDDRDASGSRFQAAERPGFTAGRAVVAVVDTGINPYHAAFRDDTRTWRANATLAAYTSPWMLPLTLDAVDMDAALKADEGVWDQVEEARVYDVPGTTIVGVVAFGQPAPAEDAPRRAPGLDEVGHGTATAGMVQSACPSCLIVAVETGGATEARHALDWIRDQSWIDVIAYPARAGIGFVGAGVHHADPDDTGGFAWGRANVEAGQLVVVAAGNGWQDVTSTGATAYSPARDVSYSYWTAGPDWVLTVGASDPRSDGASTWHTYPVDILGPGRDCRAPHPFRLTGEIAFAGTSCAAPVVAGQLGHVLGAVREAHRDGATGPRSGQRLSVPDGLDGDSVTREDLVRAFLLTARPLAADALPVEVPDPTDPSGWSTGGGPLAPPVAGWGIHDEETMRDAVAVLTGAVAAPVPRDPEAAWFPVDQRIRLDAWGPWSRGDSRIAFPEPHDGPVRAPVTPDEVAALYATVTAG